MLELLEQYRVRELHVCSDPDTGLSAFIAIHDTRMGPALGGCRFQTYSDEESAIRDACRLARGMSYKAALAGLPQGGGKSVIMRPSSGGDCQPLFQRFGEFVEQLGGRYITAIDAGTSSREMDWIAGRTRHVTSTSRDENPSSFTARGVFLGIQAAVRHKFGLNSLEGLRVLVQGVGNVGQRLCQLLHEAGARLLVSDVNGEALRQVRARFPVKVIEPEAVFTQACEVFAPCGLGAVLTPLSIAQLRCAVVAGSANNQLLDESCGQLLHQAGILYAPDYVINAGGLIQVSLHHRGKGSTVISEKVGHISATLKEIFRASEQKGLPTSLVADRMAEEKLYPARDQAA